MAERPDQINIRLSPEYRLQLAKLSADSGLTKSDVIRVLISKASTEGFVATHSPTNTEPAPTNTDIHSD